MQKFTQKYTIVAFLEEMHEGAEYPSSQWPLHVTVADTFAVGWKATDLSEKLSLLSDRHAPSVVTAAHDEHFGPERQTQVTILKVNDELTALHYDVVALLEDAGAVFNNPQYTREGFRAHITVQPHARLDEGDYVMLDNLAIVDMFPREDPYLRKVISIVKLGE
jgi:2'-5' RNA ligase